VRSFADLFISAAILRVERGAKCQRERGERRKRNVCVRWQTNSNTNVPKEPNKNTKKHKRTETGLRLSDRLTHRTITNRSDVFLSQLPNVLCVGTIDRNKPLAIMASQSTVINTGSCASAKTQRAIMTTHERTTNRKSTTHTHTHIHIHTHTHTTHTTQVTRMLFALKFLTYDENDKPERRNRNATENKSIDNAFEYHALFERRAKR
jgi:hypothetical protein